MEPLGYPPWMPGLGVSTICDILYAERVKTAMRMHSECEPSLI